jgi:hypothetical protein
MQRNLAARERTLRALRLRQPKKISLHELDEVVGSKTMYRVIFGSPPNPALNSWA